MITIILAMGLLLHDAYGASGGFEGFAQQNWVWVITVLFLPKLLLLLIYQKLCQQALKIPSTQRLKRLDRMGSILRLLLLTSYAMDLMSGGLNWARQTLGDWVLLDESVVLLPTLLTYLLFWRIYYPVDRKVREAMAFAAVDAGEPVAPIWTMNQYLIAQIRHSLLIPGIPLLILLGWTEALNMAPENWITLPGRAGEPGMSLYTPLSLGGAAAVFLATPVMIRCLWDTHAMPSSPMRLRLLQLCKDYRVRVREILYWKTFGGMANGAVIGFIGPLRYILLTDVLLSQMAPSSIEAVMAHEIAHIRKKHMFWMIGGAGAMLVIYQLVFSIGFLKLGQFVLDHVSNPQAFEIYINDNTTSALGLLLGA
ncbi:MAG: M48 family metalloprotease [Phycisphaeraceae bacterium]|nr:M48 family metalloprotease [Phycisphaeraceae bacterium]